MSVKQKILDIVKENLDNKEWLAKNKNSDLREMIEESDFYLQKGKDAYDDFMKFDVNKEELSRALDKSRSAMSERRKVNPEGKKEIEVMREELFNNKYSFNKNDQFAEKLNTLVAYFDTGVAGSKSLNEYEPSRGVYNAIIWQQDWYTNLIKHKLDKTVTLAPSIGNAMSYLSNPTSNVSMVNDNHRKMFSEKILGKEYNDNINFSKEIQDMFKLHKKLVRNKENYTIFCTRLLYDDEIRKLWNNPDPNDMKQPLNKILYGPPGTGKTYTTKRLAVRIVIGKSINKLSDDEILEKYKKLTKDGRISFVTFHQSYGYEEFVEGIRPFLGSKEDTDVDDGEGQDISYHIQDGIFKELCKKANQDISTDGYGIGSKTSIGKTNNIKDIVWQVKLGEGDEFNDDCFNNGYIRRGSYHFPNVDLNGVDEDFFRRQKQEVPDNKRDVDMNKAFYSDMKANELVVVYRSRRTICAIGVLTDEGYNLLKNVGGNYAHSRSVRWLWIQDPNEHSINISDIKVKGLDRRSISRAHGISPNALLNKLRNHVELSNKERYFELSESEDGHKQNNYVLIIDEINRGNISKILGELITLLEEDKREGEDEELEVTLPYSGETFSVPNNLHIIGTMNTADRSIAFLDTALRRRFQFEEMMPEYELVNYDIDGIRINKVLETINNGIKRELDRDHQIGHSYFMGDKVKTMEGLGNVFRNSICPLLDEYFHEHRNIIPEILNGSNLIKGEDDNWEWNDEAFKDPANYKKIYAS